MKKGVKIGTGIGISYITGLFGYDHYNIRNDSHYIFEMPKWRRYDRLIIKSMEKHGNIMEHVQMNVLPKKFTQNENIMKWINDHLYDIRYKKAIAVIYTPSDLKEVTLKNLVYHTADKILEYLRNNNINWQENLVHIPIEYWNKQEINNALLKRVLPNNMDQTGSVAEILFRNKIFLEHIKLTYLVISNDEFNKLIKLFGKEPVKYFYKDGKHWPMHYTKDGYYEDCVPFYPDWSACTGGGLYFTLKEHAQFGEIFSQNADVQPDDNGYTQFRGKDFKTNAFHLSNIRKKDYSE